MLVRMLFGSSASLAKQSGCCTLKRLRTQQRNSHCQLEVAQTRCGLIVELWGYPLKERAEEHCRLFKFGRLSLKSLFSKGQNETVIHLCELTCNRKRTPTRINRNRSLGRETFPGFRQKMMSQVADVVLP